MTIEQLRQRMGADATDAEAFAMSVLLDARYGILAAGVEELDMADEDFFALIPEAIEKAKYMEGSKKKCSICGKTYDDWPNNAWPVNEGKCCKACNWLYVIPARIQAMEREKKEKK